MGHCEWFYIIRGLSVYKACIDFPLTWSYRKQDDIPLSIPCWCHLMVWVRLSIPFHLGVSGARKSVLWYSCVKFTSMDGWSRGRELHKLAHKAAWPFAISPCLGSLDSPPLLPISSYWWSLVGQGKQFSPNSFMMICPSLTDWISSHNSAVPVVSGCFLATFILGERSQSSQGILFLADLGLNFFDNVLFTHLWS